MEITIKLSDDEARILRKRADENFMTIHEQIEDIIRRSCVSTKKGRTKKIKVDDKLIEIFSREKKGRKKK